MKFSYLSFRLVFTTAFVIVAGTLAIVVLPSLANAKSLNKCAYHKDGGFFPIQAELIPGSDGRSIAFRHGRGVDAMPLPPGMAEPSKFTCVVHLDCDIPESVGTVNFRYEGVNENKLNPGILGKNKDKELIALKESWVKPGFPVHFLDANDVIIKKCKIAGITDN